MAATAQRTGIISDVHGNIQALEAVLRALEKAGVERLICLGDVVGYGADPELCVQRLRREVDESLLGNHDAATCGRSRVRYAREEGRRIVEYSREQLSDESLRWLRARPLRLREGDVEFVHGRPDEPAEFRYVLSLDQASALSESFASLSGLSFVGHSHVEHSYRLWPGGATEILTDRLVVGGPWKYLVNVGSVGQPRDRDPRAAAAVYDRRRGVVEFLRASYDINAAAGRIREAGLPEIFARRLYSGW